MRLFGIILIIFLNSCMTKNITEIKLINKSFNGNIIKPHYDLVAKNYNEIKNNIYYIKIEKNNILITLLDKSDFNGSFDYKIDDIFGYYYYENIPVIVFGDEANIFFKKTNKSNEFPFLKELNITEDEDIPEIFEPEVWMFEYSNDNFKLIGKDYSI